MNLCIIGLLIRFHHHHHQLHHDYLVDINLMPPFCLHFSANWEPVLLVFCPASSLAVEQDTPDRLQSRSSGRHRRWHNGDDQSRKRWDLLCRVAKLFSSYEEPSRQIQWSPVCRPKRKRWVSKENFTAFKLGYNI